jgi:hypothetical protein
MLEEMSFLDNLENTLKSLESREEADTQRERQNREADRARALAAAPWADRLKNGPFTRDLLSHATRLGFARRLKVRPTWIGATLRLEAGDRRLDLEPGPEGITARFFENSQPGVTRPIHLDAPAEALAREWLA